MSKCVVELRLRVPRVGRGYKGLGWAFGVLTLVACGPFQAGDVPMPEEADPDAGQSLTLEADRALLLSTVVAEDLPWQARWSVVDVNSGVVTELLTGESSDSVVFGGAGGDLGLGEAWILGRSAEAKNMRRVFRESTRGAWVLGAQRRWPVGAVGDPHDVVALNPEHLLVANFSAGSLAVVERRSGKSLSEWNYRATLPEGVTPRPESILIDRKVSASDGEAAGVWIVHQGLGLRDGLFFANGTQSIIEFTRSGKMLRRIPLQGSFPVVPRRSDGAAGEVRGARILLVSLCSRYVATPSQLANAEACRARVEWFDPRLGAVAEDAWELPQGDLWMNGMVVQGSRPEEFFASVERGSAVDGRREIVRCDAVQRKCESVYSFGSGIQGFWGYFLDEIHGQLLIGESMIGGGRLVRVRLDASGGEVVGSIALAGAPYSGVWMTVPAAVANRIH